MKDIPLIAGIVIFWFVVTIILTGMSNDTSIRPLIVDGNTTTDFEIDPNSINFTEVDFTKATNPVTFLGILKRVFTFKLSTIIEMPSVIAATISLLNYLLVVIFGILIFRQFSLGGGSG